MAAPSNLYSTKNFKLIKSTDSKVHNMAIRSLFPVTNEELKDRFKLDYKMNLISLIEDCFIGAVIQGGENATYHNVNRYGIVFENLIILKDAGLNIKPYKPMFVTHSGLSTKIQLLTNSILLRATAQSTEYANTEIYLKAADSQNLNIYEENYISTLVADDIITFYGDNISFDSLYFRYGKTYILTVKSTNEEGDTYSEYLSLSPMPEAVSFKYGVTLDLAISTSAASTSYVNRMISNAVVSDNIIFYANGNATEYSITGYYLSIEADTYGNYKFFNVTTEIGQVTTINSIVSRHQDEYYYYSPVSVAEAITNSPSQIYLYYKVEITPTGSDFEKRTYFVSSFADANYAAQGYYVKENRTTSIYIDTNGVCYVFL